MYDSYEVVKLVELTMRIQSVYEEGQDVIVNLNQAVETSCIQYADRAISSFEVEIFSCNYLNHALDLFLGLTVLPTQPRVERTVKKKPF